MKKLLFLILIAFVMDGLKSQVPTPPVPPRVGARVTKSGIAYSEADTGNSYAFSCTFGKEYYPKIQRIVKREFEAFPSSKRDVVWRIDKTETKGKFELKIELRAEELKISYKAFKGVTRELYKLKAITRQIIQL